MIQITDGIAIDERHVVERFVRGSGPGGQNVNKVATAVELRFDTTALAPAVRERLVVLAGSRLTADGILLIDSREHRTQAQNREAARARLIDLLREAARPPKKRRPTKVRAAERAKRLESKKHRGAIKSSRRAGRGQHHED